MARRETAPLNNVNECTAVVREDCGISAPACQVDFVHFVCAARRHCLATGSLAAIHDFFFFLQRCIRVFPFPQNRRDEATENNRGKINVGFF